MRRVPAIALVWGATALALAALWLRPAPAGGPAGAAPAAIGGSGVGPAPNPQRGQALFAAKGCVTCHVHADFPAAFSLEYGPDLSRYAADPAFLERWLGDPRSVRPQARMPDLGLSAAEIRDLIAYLNGE